MNTTENLKAEFDKQGFIQCSGFFNEDDMTALLAEIRRVGQARKDGARLDKGNMVFYHNVYRESEKARLFITRNSVVNLLQSIIGPDFWIRWDQAVGKYPGGCDFPWHQDNAYNRLKDMHFQLWIGLTDMKEESGGLWLQPGSHKHGHLPHRWEDNHLACEVQPEKEVFINAKKGDVILFSSMMLHRTTKNTLNTERWAYVIEFMSSDHYDPYVKGPYFMVSENGRTAPRFVRTYKGRNLINRSRYMYFRLRDKFYKAIGSKRTPTILTRPAS